MRLTFVLGLALMAAPALAEPSIRLIPATPEVDNEFILFVDDILAGLAGEYAGCPVEFIGTGEVPLTMAYEPGPPAGWKLWIGPDAAPVYEASGPSGESGATALLEWLCNEGGADVAAGAAAP